MTVTAAKAKRMPAISRAPTPVMTRLVTTPPVTTIAAKPTTIINVPWTQVAADRPIAHTGTASATTAATTASLDANHVGFSGMNASTTSG